MLIKSLVREYPVSWLDPVTAAWLGEAIEIVCPPLLVFGLATRFAALPMLILSLVIQFSCAERYRAVVQLCSLAMPEAQEIPASHSLMNRSSRGPTVLSAIRHTSLGHRIITAAR